MTYYLSLDNDPKNNKFQFVCPIFETKVHMAHCVHLRNIVWCGGRSEIRRGCQACMLSGKCPASEIVRKISFHKDTPDDYGSATPVLGKIRRDVLEKVAPVIVQEKHMQELRVSEAERALIMTASERIRKLIPSAPEPSNAAPNYSRRAPTSSDRAPRSTRRQAAPKPTSTVNNAARTGDMSAAINMEAS